MYPWIRRMKQTFTRYTNETNRGESRRSYWETRLRFEQASFSVESGGNILLGNSFPYSPVSALIAKFDCIWKTYKSWKIVGLVVTSKKEGTLRNKTDFCQKKINSYSFYHVNIKHPSTYTFPTSHSWHLYDVKHVHNREFIHGFQLIKMRIGKNFEGWYFEIIIRNSKKFIYFLFVWFPGTRCRNIRTESPNALYIQIMYLKFMNIASNLLYC